MKRLFFLSALLCLSLSVPKADALPAASDTSAGDGINAFACNLYARLQKHKGNLFFSPLGISYALAAAGVGARGESAAQMEKALHASGEQERQALAALMQRLNAAQHGEQLRITIANSLWPHKDYPLRPEYMEAVRNYYDAAVIPLDYAGDAAAAAARINAWIGEKTRGRIRDMVGAPPGDTRLLLVNAVYFDARWMSPFESHATRKRVFYAPDKAIEAPFMSREGVYGYRQIQDLQILELPYYGEKCSLVVLLPAAKPGALEELEKHLSAQRLAQWTEALPRQEVQVFLPKFKLSWGPASLNEALGALGIREAFSPESADFSGMSPEAGLYIGNVLHKANVEVDEAGTVAAAASAVEFLPGSAGPRAMPVFLADRPFMFFIRDKVEGAILFMGRLTDPQ